MRHIFAFVLLFCLGLSAQFSKVLQFTISPTAPSQSVTLTLGKKGDKPAVAISVSSRLVLTDVTGEHPKVLLDSPLNPCSASASLIHLWFAEDKTQLAQDDIILAEGLPIPQLPSRPAIISSHPAITEGTKPVFQRIAPINFQDDFARAEQNDSLWTTLCGKFALNMALNPASASGAFQLWGQSTEEEGLAVASSAKWYWRDFRFGASVLPGEATRGCGLVFAFRNKDTFYRFELDRQDDTARIIRRDSGKDTILAQKHCRMPAAWTRLEIATDNGGITAFAGGRRVLHYDGNTVCSGAVGLYLRHSKSVFFDDVSLSSCTSEAMPFGPCEQRWSDLSGKHFFTDPFMAQWAHPRSFWHSGADGLQWFRSRLFSDVSFTWKKPDSQSRVPVRGCRIRLFADEEHLDSGFLLDIQQGKATISLDNAVIGEASAPADLTDISITAGQDIAVSMNGTPTFSWKAPSPVLRKGSVAATFGKTRSMHQLYHYDWRDATSVSSSHRLDYSFEHAPAAWFPQAGTWKATHRWACVPKWSFFAGRGEPGPADIKNGNTILWNLRQITGDFDLEIFAAPMEGTPQRAHFTYPLNINVAFAADGTALDSGYTFINGLYDLPSRLYRNNQLLGTSDARFAPGLRLNEMAWYQRVTRVWQHVRIQRRNGRILIDSASHDDHANYMPLKREFDLEDTTDPTQPSQFALWTWGENGLAIARATLSFQASSGAAPLPEHTPPPRICHGNGTRIPRTYRRVVNPISGGQFTATIWDTPFQLLPGTTMEMLFNLRSPRFPAQPLPNDLHLSLFVSVNGQTAEAAICGPKPPARDTTFPISAGITAVPDKPGWLKLTASLAGIHHFFQPAMPITVNAVYIASPYSSIEEIAGLGINPAGASIEFTRPKFFPNSVKFKLPPSYQMPLPHVYGRRIFNDFADDTGDFQRFGGKDGAALLRVTDGDRGRVLRLLNQSVGGTAGVTITSVPFSLDAFPKIAFDYRIPVGMESNIIAVTDAGELEIGITPGASSSWPVVGNADIHQDGHWHHVEIDLAKLLKPRLKPPFTVHRLLLADSGRMSSYQRRAMYLDNFQLIPALADGTEISMENCGTEAIAVCFDNTADSMPDTASAITGNSFAARIPDGGASWMHIQLKRNGIWTSHTAHLRIETAPAPISASVPTQAPATRQTPPPPPIISYIPSDRLARTTFEPSPNDPDTAAAFDGFETRREAWIIHNDQTAATGKYCGELVNLDYNGFCSVFFRKAPWDIMRYPCVSFDYRFKQPECALHLSLLVNDAMTIIEWTGKNARSNHFSDAVIGQVDGTYAIQDNQWHNTSFNLLQLLQRERYAHGIPPSGLMASELATWATIHTAAGGGYENPENARIFFDNFTIYSNKGRNPAFEWTSHPQDAGYAVAFDHHPDTIPAETICKTEPCISYPDTAPGTWYVHVRIKDKAGNWSQPAHCRIVIEE